MRANFMSLQCQRIQCTLTVRLAKTLHDRSVAFKIPIHDLVGLRDDGIMRANFVSLQFLRVQSIFTRRHATRFDNPNGALEIPIDDLVGLRDDGIVQPRCRSRRLQGLQRSGLRAHSGLKLRIQGSFGVERVHSGLKSRIQLSVQGLGFIRV